MVYRSSQLASHDFRDFDEEPVYRSISLVAGDLFDDASVGISVEDEPVYRSMGDLFASGDPIDLGTVGRDADDEDDNPPGWLETMPPLVCRQRGRRSL